MRRELNALVKAAHGYWLPSRAIDGVPERRSRAGRKLNTPGEWWKSSSFADNIDTEPSRKRPRLSNKLERKSDSRKPLLSRRRSRIASTIDDNVGQGNLSIDSTPAFSSTETKKGIDETESNELPRVMSPSKHRTSPSSPESGDGNISPHNTSDSQVDKEIEPVNNKHQDEIPSRKRMRKLFSVKQQYMMADANRDLNIETRKTGARHQLTKQQKRISVVVRKPTSSRKLIPVAQKTQVQPIKQQERTDILGDSHSESGVGDLRVLRKKPIKAIQHEEGVSITTGSDEIDTQ